MKARPITSLALPAVLATAGLLGTAEAAYASLVADPAGSVKYGQHIQPMGDVTFTPGSETSCPPYVNMTIPDYGHCCTPVGNTTISDYGHCCTSVVNMTIPDCGYCCTSVVNMTIPDYGYCRDHDHQDHRPHRPDYASLDRQS